MTSMRSRGVIAAEVVLGIALLVVAGVYALTPANSLPGFFPGYDPALPDHHTKHAIAAALLGVGAFILAWFSSGPRSAK
jgi:hypothetical protein